MGLVLIFHGWKIDVYSEVVGLPHELDSSCEEHGLKNHVVVGRLLRTIDGIPYNFLWARDRIFKLCPICSKSYETFSPEIEKLILAFNKKEISLKGLQDQIKPYQDEERKKLIKESKIAKRLSEEDDKNFKKFLRLLPYVFGFLLLLLLIKLILF